MGLENVLRLLESPDDDVQIQALKVVANLAADGMWVLRKRRNLRKEAQGISRGLNLIFLSLKYRSKPGKDC